MFRRFIYNPIVNSFFRGIAGPIKQLVPVKLQIPVSGVISVDTEDCGKIKLETNPTNCLTKEVYWKGIYGYEFPVIKVFLPLIKDCKNFVDIGANIGYYALLAAKKNPDIKAFAFEPMPAAFEFLCRNIKVNGFENNITPVKLAASDSKGNVEFHVTKNPKFLYLDHHIGGSSSSARAKDQYSETIKVQMIDLDSYVDEHKISDIGMIKMDTEATENYVLAGAMNCIKRDRPLIICEVLPGRIEDKLEDIFQKLDYLYFLPEDDGLLELKTLKDLPGDKDFFFVPREKANLVKAFVKG